MAVEGLALRSLLGSNTVKGIAHIFTDIRVNWEMNVSALVEKWILAGLPTVLIQAQCAACVLNKEVEKSDLVLSDLRDGLDDLVGDEIGATGFGLESEAFLKPSHCDRSAWATSKEREQTEGRGPNEMKDSRE